MNKKPNPERDEFAKVALQGLLACGAYKGRDNNDRLVAAAYLIADLMLKEREK